MLAKSFSASLRLSRHFSIVSSVGNSARAAPPTSVLVREAEGAIVRANIGEKSSRSCLRAATRRRAPGRFLTCSKERNIRAGFFVTGDFARRADLRPQLKRIVSEGHYLGPHSDSHPLYCDWKDRKKSLVTKDFFTADLEKNLAALRALGALPSGQSLYFIPPYEWYNREQVAWAREMGVTMINFTPGSGSNRDYATEGDKAFVPSQKIYDDILAYEKKDARGLNGFLLLLHLGSGRKDPFHLRLALCATSSTRRGYQFERVDRLCE